MRRHLWILGLLAAASSGLACSVSTDDSSSQEAAHTEGDITFAQYKWLWPDDTLEEFEANAAAGSPWSAPEFLPLDDPMAVRLQFWLDTMDKALRERLPKELANTPPPKLIIQKDADPNAWVTYIPVAWNAHGRLARADAPPPEPAAPAAPPAPSDAGPSDAGGGDDGGGADAAAPAAPPAPAPIFFLLNTGKVAAAPYAGTPIVRQVDRTMLEEFVKFHDSGFAKCDLETDGEQISFGDGCVVDDQLSANVSNQIGYYGTSRWVTVTTGLILSMLDEHRIVAVLAHELGHYYRTHSAQPSDLLNYFYALGDENQARKPGADPRYLEQTLKVRDKLRENSWFVDFSEENKLMADKRLGFYTTEQEADEISLEILAKMGLPPTLGPDSELQLHEIVDDMGGSDSGDIKWEQCSALRDQGFRDESGNEVSVPVGNLADPHHSFCFRTFNMERELRAHKYTIAPNRPKPPGEAWQRLVTRLSAEVDPAPPPPPPPDGDAGSDGGSDAGSDGGPSDAGAG